MFSKISWLLWNDLFLSWIVVNFKNFLKIKLFTVNLFYIVTYLNGLIFIIPNIVIYSNIFILVVCIWYTLKYVVYRWYLTHIYLQNKHKLKSNITFSFPPLIRIMSNILLLKISLYLYNCYILFILINFY